MPSLFKPIRSVIQSGSKTEKKNYLSREIKPTRAKTSASSKARTGGFTATPQNNLIYQGGKTIQHLSFFNYYLGGSKAWLKSDIRQIDWALSQAMTDAKLNNVIQQYFSAPITSTFKGSSVLSGSLPKKFTEGNVHSQVAQLYSNGKLANFDLPNTVFNFLLPKGIILTDDKNPAIHKVKSIPFEDEADSLNGLGGYHGSLHVDATTTVYYAVGVYSDFTSARKTNGIVAFDKPWKNIVATFYHELVEARTDADVDDAIRTNKQSYCGWVNKNGEEIGDIPMREAGNTLSRVMVEVPLANGQGTVPIQLQYSNAVNGPEGPIASPHQQLI